MVYPISPFTEKLNCDLIFKIRNELTNDVTHRTDTIIQQEIFRWLCTSPEITSLRINTIKSDVKFMFEHLRSLHPNAKIRIDERLQDVIIVEHQPENLKMTYPKEIVVDRHCGAAVLRGANIFGPGVVGMTKGCQRGDYVSIYVDLEKKCKQGFAQIFEGEKKLIANGVVKMARSELFGVDLNRNGIAVEVLETMSGCPQIVATAWPSGSALLQNLPSIICVEALNPKPWQSILDMCASPGHKTSHIAQITKNEATLVALDKSLNRVRALTKHLDEFGVQAHVFLANSTKIFKETSQNLPEEGPPYGAETFDSILLDAPCSGLGNRPQFLNDITNNVLQSYVPVQKKLFRTAVNLLKTNGTLVYSTCTITLAENEGIVSWALEKFDNLKLVQPKSRFGSFGMEGTSLTKDQREMLQRFGPHCEIDSVGFFIACFVKI